MSTDCKHIDIRLLTRNDLPFVVAIEAASFEYQWSKDDFITSLQSSNCVGFVAKIDNIVVGYMLCDLWSGKYNIINFAVSPTNRRFGVGAQMVNKLKSKLSSNSRTMITAVVREKNLEAQLFFRKLGFRAVSIIHNYYKNIAEDAYLMQYLHNS